MPVFTPHFAPFVVLAFLGTAFALVLCLLIVLIGALRKSRVLVLSGLGAGLALALVYGMVLLGLSLFSSEAVLAQGEWKYFCEIDCHIAYAVAGVQVARSVGPEMQPVTASGKFVIVALKTWFDPSTISAHRGNGPLMPNERKLCLIDSAGHVFGKSPRTEAILTAAALHSAPLRTALRPGESYVSYLVFEIPSESSQLRLLLSSADEVDIALWGHEDSPFHKKAFFALPIS